MSPEITGAEEKKNIKIIKNHMQSGINNAEQLFLFVSAHVYYFSFTCCAVLLFPIAPIPR